MSFATKIVFNSNDYKTSAKYIHVDKIKTIRNTYEQRLVDRFPERTFPWYAHHYGPHLDEAGRYAAEYYPKIYRAFRKGYEAATAILASR